MRTINPKLNIKTLKIGLIAIQKHGVSVVQITLSTWSAIPTMLAVKIRTGMIAYGKELVVLLKASTKKVLIKAIMMVGLMLILRLGALDLRCWNGRMNLEYSYFLSHSKIGSKNKYLAKEYSIADTMYVLTFLSMISISWPFGLHMIAQTGIYT